MNEAAQQQCYEALAKAKAKFEIPRKTKVVSIKMKEEKGGGKIRFNYADLEEIARVVDGVLLENGLWCMYTMAPSATGADLTLHVRHVLGGEVTSTLPVPFAGCGPKEIGGTITYFKRYLKCGMFDLIAEDDDDALGLNEPDDPAEAEAEANKKKQAEELLAAMKKKRPGAYKTVEETGQIVKTDVTVLKESFVDTFKSTERPAEPVEEAKPHTTEPTAKPEDASFIDTRLVALLVKDKISQDELLTYLVKGGYLKGVVDDVTGLCDLKTKFVDQIVSVNNWKTIASRISEARKGK